MVQTLPLSCDGARAGPPALRFSRNNLISCILTLGHYDTFQMDVQKPTLSGSQPALGGPGRAHKERSSQAKG